MLLLSIIAGFCTGTAPAVADAMAAGAGTAVRLCIELCGAYMLWMGLMNVAKEAGLVRAMASGLRPALGRLFPHSPGAVEPIAMNLAANFFGMGSAATPFGLEAMARMQEANPDPARATNDMCMFLCLNAAALELVPASVLALRAAWGSADAYAVVVPTFLCSLLCSGAAILGCLLLRR